MSPAGMKKSMCQQPVDLFPVINLIGIELKFRKPSLFPEGRDRTKGCKCY